MVKISAVIITYNEERNIGRCINSLVDVADEIVVVDSFSKVLDGHDEFPLFVNRDRVGEGRVCESCAGDAFGARGSRAASSLDIAPAGVLRRGRRRGVRVQPRGFHRHGTTGVGAAGAGGRPRR